MGKKRTRDPSRAGGAGDVFLLVKWLALRAGALVARGTFSLAVKWLCAPRGPEAELVFSLSWFSRWWRGAGFFFWSSGLRSARARDREGCFDSPLPTSGLHSPRNELRAARP